MPYGISFLHIRREADHLSISKSSRIIMSYNVEVILFTPRWNTSLTHIFYNQYANQVMINLDLRRGNVIINSFA
jgi:hypothetical protein